MFRTFKLKAKDSVQKVEISVRMDLEEGLTVLLASIKEESLKDDIFQHALLPRYHASAIKVVN